MAPFYALIISFALVFLLGLLLGNNPPAKPAGRPESTPATQAPATTRPEVTFSAKDTRKFPGTGLVVVQGGERQEIADLSQLPGLSIDEKYVICADLREGWTAVEGIQMPDSEYTCWGPFDPKSDEMPVLRLEEPE
jgi:hypothetical protein